MNGFIKFTLRSREGLLSYITGICTVMGCLFFAHIIMLIIMVKDDFIYEMNVPLYSLVGAGFAGVFFAVTADRVVRFGVNCGTSRHSMLLGLAVVSPVYALATSATIYIAEKLTILFFSLFGQKLGNFAEFFVDEYHYIEELSYRFDILDIALVFLMTMLVYTFALVFLGVRGKKGTKAGIAAVMGLAALYIFFQDGGQFPFVECLLLYYLYDYTATATDPTCTIDGIYPSLALGIAIMTALVTVIFGLAFILYAVLSKRAPICGKEENA